MDKSINNVLYVSIFGVAGASIIINGQLNTQVLKSERSN